MGESYRLPGPEFNRSVKIESRPERLTGEAGALAIREVAFKLGLFAWLALRLRDPRDPDKVTHPMEELVATSVIMMAQGWPDQDDADDLRDDATMRLAVSTRSGTSPLEPNDPDSEDIHPEGLASQPTLSRMVQTLSSEENRAVLREGLLVSAGRRIRAENRGHRLRYVTIDVDSLPIEVEGHQEGSEYNGHYRSTIYHPLVANIAETGDLIDVQLRHGKAHTAEGATDFILPLLDRVEDEIGMVASVRFDAGFPSEPLLAGLEQRERPVAYVARLRSNAVLKRMAEPYLNAVPPCCGDGEEPQVFLVEKTYQAGTWSRPRRVVLVLQQVPGELFPNAFWLLTSWTPEQVSAEQLLALYRRRGQAEGYYGEWMHTLTPALSSTRRPKSHYRGQEPQKRTPSRDPFAANEVLLLLSALAYNLMHAVRVRMERATRKGWSIQRLRERVLKVPARVLIHARRVVFVIAHSAARNWNLLWHQLNRMPGYT